MYKRVALLSAVSLTCVTLAAEEEQCCPPMGPNSSITLRHREAGGVGYDGGYSTAALFLTPEGECTWQYFLDGRIHRLRKGPEFAANVGLGLRYGPYVMSPVYGINAFYDYRGENHLTSHQVGVGLETFFRCVDLRANGYLPVGKKDKRTKFKFSGFSGNSLVFKRRFLANLPKVEVSAGAYIPGIFRAVDLYAEIGPYYLFQRKRFGRKFGDTWGGEIRMSAKLFTGLSVGGSFTYDDTFKERVQGYISYTFPWGPYAKKKSDPCTIPCQARLYHAAQMVEPVHRSEIIPIERKSEKAFDLSSAAASIYASLNAIFVQAQGGGVTLSDELGSMATFNNPGNGTFENPYATLQLAENFSSPGDLIYVFYTDDTPAFTKGIKLQDRQRLIGSGAPFNYFGVQIPPFPGDAGQRVTLTNDSGTAVIEAAQENEIAGFRIVNTDVTNGITTPSNVASISIHDNLFTNTNPVSKIGIAMAITGINNISILNNIFEEQDTDVKFTFNDNDNPLDFTALNNNFSGVMKGMDIVIDSPNPGTGITHNLNIQNNEFNASMMTFTQMNSPTDNSIFTTIIGNHSTTGFMFTNSIAGGTGTFTIQVPSSIVSSGETAVQDANNGTPVNFSGQTINVVKTAP